MTDQQLKDWMSQHPEVTRAVDWLRKQDGIKLSGFEVGLVREQARVDGMAVEDGDVTGVTVRAGYGDRHSN